VDQDRAVRSEGRPARRALEQNYVELSLEARDRPARIRLCHVEVACGSAEAAVVVDADEQFQCDEVQ
jgi:hypothetical protein